jgi:hypothetical protein
LPVPAAHGISHPNIPCFRIEHIPPVLRAAEPAVYRGLGRLRPFPDILGHETRTVIPERAEALREIAAAAIRMIEGIVLRHVAGHPFRSLTEGILLLEAAKAPRRAFRIGHLDDRARRTFRIGLHFPALLGESHTGGNCHRGKE